jgi:aspartate-semialdehyde dehydrogenase
MPIPETSLPIAIVGASSLRGKELRDVLEERGVPGEKVRLFDEDIAVGTLTRSGDEAAVIAAVDETSFAGTKLVFFAGRAEMAGRHAEQALRAGARVIDLSEDPGLGRATPWIPALDPILSRPQGTGQAAEKKPLRSPSAAAIVAASLAAALGRFQPVRLAITFLRPVSERGQEGIDELERQTVSLLSFQPLPQGVFGTQVAFNLMDACGAGDLSLDAVREAVVRDVVGALGGRAPIPAIQLLQAPVFFSYAFTAYVDLGAPAETAEIEAALASAGLSVKPASEPRPTSMSVTGRPEAVLGPLTRDASQPAGFWLWGAADNARSVAANAVAIAESLG